MYIGTQPYSGIRARHTYTATAGQTSFSGAGAENVTLTYADELYIDVYQNGVKLSPADYTATSGTTVVLGTGATVSDIIEVIKYDAFSVADTVSAKDGGGFGGNISTSGTLAVTGASTLTGGIANGVTINGTTPTLTIGDAGAEDAKIVFDGNAQDYHIGLDDSADTLVIGKGSALGTTTAMSFDANGIITKPLQPAFLAHPASTITNIATGANNGLAFATERFDQNSDYNNSNYTFTAPVTGKYQANIVMYINNLDSAVAYYEFTLTSSNKVYYTIVDPDFGQDNGYFTLTFAALIDMDAADTATIGLHQQGGSSQTDVSSLSMWSMYLVA
jgi:hypothetical protein